MEDHGWNHSICRGCYAKLYPNREPVRCRDNPYETCCYCGKLTNEGIYYRDKPNQLYCADPA